MAQETIITLAPEVQQMAGQLIRTYHPELVECAIERSRSRDTRD